MSSVVAYVGRAFLLSTNLIDGFADKGRMAWLADFKDRRIVMRRPTVDGEELAEFRSLSRDRPLEQPVAVATSWYGWPAAAYSDNLPSSHNTRKEAHI